MKRRRLLLTGATGFIGRHLLDEAVSRGYEVYVAIRSSRNRSTLSHLPIQMIEVDYSSAEQMTDAFGAIAHDEGEPPFDLVVHNAGLTKSTRIDQFMEVNAEHTRRLILALEAQSALPQRFVLMSSMGSYGTNTTDIPMSSTMSQRPNTAYGRSKYQAEQYLKASSLPYTILCPTGVYGAGEEDYFMSISTMMRGWSFVSGRTEQRLSFIYVRDVVRAVFFVLERKEAEGQTFLLSDGRAYTDSDFTRIVSSIIRHPVRQVRVPLSVIWIACVLGQTYGRITHHPYALNRDKYPILKGRNWLCDITPLINMGFEPLYDLESGLMETYRLTNGFRR